MIPIAQAFDALPPCEQHWLCKVGVGKQMKIERHLLAALLVTMRTPGELFKDELHATDVADIALRVTSTPSIQAIGETLYPNTGWNLYRHPLARLQWTPTVTTLHMLPFRISVSP